MHHESNDTETIGRLPSTQQQQQAQSANLSISNPVLALTCASALLSNANIQKSPAAIARSAYLLPSQDDLINTKSELLTSE